jgi:uncharacterized protein YndB with AHSA1/START domain
MQFRLQSADLTLLDRAPILNRQEILLEEPPARVWPAIAEAAEWTAWWDGMRTCRYTSDGPLAVGTTRTVSVAGLRVDERLLAVDVEERYAFRVERANVPFLAAMVEDVRLVDDAGRTRLIYTQAVALRRWASPLRPLFERQLRRALRDGLAGLPRWLTDRR